MHLFSITLLLFTFNLSASIRTCDKENNGLQTDFQYNNEFFQDIKDWFYNLKNQIYEQLFEVRSKLRNYEWQLLNLCKDSYVHNFFATLFFNSNEDLKFRIGNWYFIRKDFINQNEFKYNSDELDVTSQSSSIIQSKDSIETNTEITSEIINDLKVTKSLPRNLFTTILIQQSDAQTTIQTIEQANEQLKNNEADNDFVHKVSAEVLMG
ncbi:uncharacterized protein LOC114577301 isoform X1 [Apis cerana]|uniref:uncharacterized protein LOC114577301 isoform X1 n=1 Tax=Apis cerana TaxID=7461 RepID=UPI002B22C078|nr:uncharacterized protein LOC114577301 isoform X1 [Apis cerana]